MRLHIPAATPVGATIRPNTTSTDRKFAMSRFRSVGGGGGGGGGREGGREVEREGGCPWTSLIAQIPVIPWARAKRPNRPEGEVRGERSNVANRGLSGHSGSRRRAGASVAVEGSDRSEERVAPVRIRDKMNLSETFSRETSNSGSSPGLRTWRISKKSAAGAAENLERLFKGQPC